MRWVWCVGLAVGLSGCFLFPEDNGPMNSGPSSSGPAVNDDSIPDLPYCQSVMQWPSDLIDAERRVFALVNEVRAVGATCGGQRFGATGALTLNGGLTCSARAHSEDMDVRMFFSHDNPSGESPFHRMDRAGFVYSTAGENIASGQPSADSVMAGWLDSPGHCANIMEPAFTHIGVGLHVADDGIPFWTQNFGTPL